MGAYRPDSQSCGRFLSNVVLFLVYPCVCYYQCLDRTFGIEPTGRRTKSSVEKDREREPVLDETSDDDDHPDGGGGGGYDLRLQRQGLLRGTTLVQKQVPLTTPANTTTGGSEQEQEEEDENQEWGLAHPQKHGRTKDQSDDEMSKLLTQNERGRSQELESGEENRYPGRYSNSEDEATDIRYVLDVMNEGRKTMRELHSSSLLELGDLNSGNDIATQSNRDQAGQLVADLLGAKVVYRRLEVPCGGVLMPPDGHHHPYSLQGYFIAVGPDRYQFFTYASLKQFWTVEEGSSQMVQIEPRSLCSGTFTQTYNSKMEVWLTSDLSVEPKEDAPVINLQYQQC